MVFLLRVVAYLQQSSEIARDPLTAYSRREEWQAFDPHLIAEGLFAAANIFRCVCQHLMEKAVNNSFQCFKTGTSVFYKSTLGTAANLFGAHGH